MNDRTDRRLCREAAADLRTARAKLKAEADTRGRRELSLAITKVDEALLWLEADEQLAAAPPVAVAIGGGGGPVEPARA